MLSSERLKTALCFFLISFIVGQPNSPKINKGDFKQKTLVTIVWSFCNFVSRDSLILSQTIEQYIKYGSIIALYRDNRHLTFSESLTFFQTPRFHVTISLTLSL